MHRRLLSALALVSLLIIAGCLGTAVGTEDYPELDPTFTDNGTQVPQPNERAPVHRVLPVAPDSITVENVGPFVADYEETRLHNELVRDHSNLVSLGTSCTVSAVEPADESITVTVECGHWYEFAEGDQEGIADGAPYEITYTVSDDGRIDHGDREHVY